MDERALSEPSARHPCRRRTPWSDVGARARRQRGPLGAGRRPGVLAKVAAGHVCECGARAGSLIDDRPVNRTARRRRLGPARLAASIVLLLALEVPRASADAGPAGADTVVLLQPAAAS